MERSSRDSIERISKNEGIPDRKDDVNISRRHPIESIHDERSRGHKRSDIRKEIGNGLDLGTVFKNGGVAKSDISKFILQFNCLKFLIFVKEIL